MKYFLRIGAIADLPEVEINEGRFSLLKSSKAILTEVLRLEEEYEIVIINYLDMEKEASNAAASNMVRGFHGYADAFDILLGLNVRLMNLLASVRLYLDDLSSNLSFCLPGANDIEERVKKLRSSEYDNHFDYRFMEALRNHAQHHGKPVHAFSTSAGWIGQTDNALMEFSLGFSARKEYLIADHKFNKQVLNEMPDEVDLWSASRGYIESVSTIHDQARKLIRENVTNARATIQAAIDDYTLVCKNHSVGLYAYIFDGDKKIDEVAVFLNYDDIRLVLEKRNARLVNLRKKYFTGKPKKNG